MFTKSLLSVSIASILLTSSLAVSANTKDEKEDDSVNSWGKWAQNYATAAGGEFNTGALAFASLGQGETGRNDQNEPEFEQGGGCDAGAFCGFTAFRGYSYSSDGGEGQYDGGEGFGVGKFGLNVDPELFPDFADGGEGGNIKRKLGTPVTGDFTVTASTEELTVDGLTGSANPYSGRLSRSDGAEGDGTYTYAGAYVNYRDTKEPSVLVRGGWGVYAYTYGPDFYEDNWLDGQFIGGTTTSLDQLNEFVSNLNGAVATYSGWAFGAYGARTSQLDSLSINFGTRTWDATFNGGENGRVRTVQTIDGNTQLLGEVGFAVTGGAVNGINFSAGSNQLSALDASDVSGTVNGAVFGDAAQSVAGMIDVTKDGQAYQAVFRGSQNILPPSAP